jgi:hypothetical protein
MLPSIDRAAREEILAETLHRMDPVPLAQLTAEVMSLTDAEEDEEEVMEPADTEKDARDIRKGEVAYIMVRDLLQVVMEQLRGDNARMTKVWNKQILMEIACMVIANVEIPEQERVKQAIVDEWMKTMRQHSGDLQANDRQFRMYSEIAHWLRTNGWQGDAEIYQKRALRRQSRAIRAERYLRTWEKIIEEVTELAFA